MSMLRPMRDELFKYRKRKRTPTNGSIPGVPYTGYRKSRHYVSGLPYVPGGPGLHHGLYNWGTPREYQPNLNVPSIDWTEYDPYEPLAFGHIPKHDHSRLPHDSNNSSQEIPTAASLPADDLTLTEQFLMAMGKINEIEQGTLEESSFNINNNVSESPLQDVTQLPAALRSIDEFPDLETLKDAFVKLVDVLPEDHPDLVNVRTAMRKVRDHKIALSEMNETDAFSYLPIGAEIENNTVQLHPYQEAEQFFIQQMELLEKSFEDQAIELVGPQVADLLESNAFGSEQMPDEIFPEEPIMEEQTLEQIVQENLFEGPAQELLEQDMIPDEMAADMSMPYVIPEPDGYHAGMIADEINQAMDEVTQAPMSQEEELDPFQPLYNPYMMGQNMFGQMQYMADPFMMPGPCGPMGPMPGP